MAKIKQSPNKSSGSTEQKLVPDISPELKAQITHIGETAVLEWHDKDPIHGCTYDLIHDEKRLAAAAEMELRVWQEQGFGDLDEYAQHIKHSRTFAAFNGKECVGVGRLFAASEAGLPPFVTSMPFYEQDVRTALNGECEQGLAEEFGTVAVSESLRDGIVFTHIARLSYRDARARGVKTWGIIREPELVAKWNEHYGFTFKQVGESIDYQGGMCAAHIMDLDEVDRNMSQKFPEIYDWFVNQPLDA
ncbi:MAG TPA: hypothetical protein VFI84_04375 [Candidatus Saccharimonadales bacterium]|nr:hypothetical protein [Candidatus Saccharimonadales bacterium]